MHPRVASHTLERIAAYLELHGENAFKIRAYRGAAKSVRALTVDDLSDLVRSGEIAGLRGLGPATIAVVRDLVETGESRYLEQLRGSTPEGLLEMLDVPGLRPEKIHKIHQELGVESVEDLEEAARSGRLATVAGIGPKTSQKILEGIAFLRRSGSLRLYHHAWAEGTNLRALVASHPSVTRAEIAGPLRRHCETVGAIDVVAACSSDPTEVAASFTRTGGIAKATQDGNRASIHFVDGAHLELLCVAQEQFGLALWLQTGADTHVREVARRLAARGIAVRDATLVGTDGSPLPLSDERAIYAAAGLAYVEPEMREGLGEIDAAASDAGLPELVMPGDIRGALHCHTHYSDGRQSLSEMAEGARARGWSYLGVSDHSESAFYASGMTRERVLAQHEEIDDLNARLAADGTSFRLLKGIEADILADGRLDYDHEWLARFDYVVASIHARFNMNGAAMTNRILAAMDDPFMTILAHPTGRLLLDRPPYDVDVEAILEKAAERGIAIEHNADPHRLDLDWRYLHRAKTLGVRVSIGPDAHSVAALDNVSLGVGMVRKGWLSAMDVLETRDVDEVLRFAAARRSTSF